MPHVFGGVTSLGGYQLHTGTLYSMAVLYVMPPQGICCMYSGGLEGGHKRHGTDVAKEEERWQAGGTQP